MMILLLNVCLASPPPLPTWTELDIETTVDPDPIAQHEPVSTPTTPSEGVVVSTPETLPPHGWADERALMLSLSGDLGTAYYITATARAEGLTAHWRQGPILGEGQTMELPLELPADLVALMPEVGRIDVHLLLASTTLDDQPKSQLELGRIQILHTPDGLVGVPRAERVTQTIQFEE